MIPIDNMLYNISSVINYHSVIGGTNETDNRSTNGGGAGVLVLPAEGAGDGD